MQINEETLYSSVRELSQLIRTRKLTSVALTEAYLDRLEKIGPKLNAVVTVTRELALAEARAADSEIGAGRYRGPLHGIPYGLKDLIATKGIATTWGAAPYKNQVFDYDATIVKKLREAGAVLIAKLAMVELAGGMGYNNADASFTGPGRTPWNTDYWSGGSSSGSGAATAAGLVAFSIGSETNGSIITPSTFCGLSGLRPTYGRVSRNGAMALCWSLDKLGPMCRTADDCGLVLAAIAGYDPLDATSVNRQFVYPESTPAARGKKFKIGVIKGTVDNVQPAVKQSFEAAIKTLGQFATVSEVDYPDLPYDQVIEVIVGAEGASAFRDLIESGRVQELREANDKWGGYAAYTILAVDYLQALRARGPIKRALDELYAKYDALIAPSLPTVAWPINTNFDKVYPGIGGGPSVISAGNCAGLPAISVPCGFDENNLPAGLQFTGRAWSEARLATIANLYQQATDWHKRRPKVS